MISVFFKDGELTSEEIAKVTDHFTKHLALVQENSKCRFPGFKDFLCGDKITIADFVIFSLLSCFVYNKNLKSKALGEALVKVMADLPDLSGYYERIAEIFKDYLAARPAIIF